MTILLNLNYPVQNILYLAFDMATKLVKN